MYAATDNSTSVINIALVTSDRAPPHVQPMLQHASWNTQLLTTQTLRAELKARSYAAIFFTHLPSDSLLLDILALQPEAVRVMLHDALHKPQASTLELIHRAIPDSVPSAQLAAQIRSMVRINRVVFNPKIRRYIESIGQLPSPPAIYHELTRTLSSPNSNSARISELISRDPALTAHILKVANSAYFRIRRKTSNINEAVTLLGFSMLRSLALSGHLMSQYPQHRTWSYFSFEALNRRALLVARLAQHICQEMKAPRHVQDQAFVSGILQDLGMLVFASHDPKSYRKVMVRSAQDDTPLCVVEKKMLGVYHGEVAAFLLAQWQLPAAIVEAVLLRHTPQLANNNEEFSPLTALHIADALIAPVETEISANLATRLRKDYLQQQGMLEKLPQWRQQAEALVTLQ